MSKALIYFHTPAKPLPDLSQLLQHNEGMLAL